MHPATSILLDTMRFTAACVVFLSHVTSRDFNLVLPWVRWGHEAVVAFFVMSGFVIAYVITTRERSASQYASARLGRLYSVVLPSLALTAILDTFGRNLDAELYKAIPNDSMALRLTANLLFLQQNWNLTVIPLSNGPFWSLGYEFWYYLIFGVWTFTRGKLSIALTLSLCFCAGPRIIASFPLWLLGVIGYKIHDRWIHFLLLQKAAFLLTTIAIIAVITYGNPLSQLWYLFEFKHLDRYIDVSGIHIFIGDISCLPEDFLLGILISLLLITSRGFGPWIIKKAKLALAIKYLSGSTFSLYLFHAPLLFFFTAALGMDRSSSAEVIVIALLVFLLCLLLSYVSERKVSTYRRIFLSLISSVLATFKNTRSTRNKIQQPASKESHIDQSEG